MNQLGSTMPVQDKETSNNSNIKDKGGHVNAKHDHQPSNMCKCSAKRCVHSKVRRLVYIR